MTLLSRWTTELVAQMPQLEGERYEIIDGELLVTTQPHYMHQSVSFRIGLELQVWSNTGNQGAVLIAPGLIYADDEAVAPDVVWISRERMTQIVGDDGKLHGSPDLVIEVLSPGKANEERDREKKLDLYARRGVPEYWIVDWRAQTIDVYRRGAEDAFDLVQTLHSDDVVSSPVLAGFSCPIKRFFEL
jgi:Uma2 family endonuclease